jgi:hypothetical protein
VAEALTWWLPTTGSLTMADFPVRVAVAVPTDEDGQTERTIACAAEFSHMAVDY